jgi:hypothetical protein
VSICTYTDSHVELALMALARGKHVLVEKPVSLCSSEVARLVVAARNSGLICMPAMCMRFAGLGSETGAWSRSGAAAGYGQAPFRRRFYLDERRVARL